MAVYGFARLADELGDSAQGDRLALLDDLEVELGAAFGGVAHHPLLQELAVALREKPLPREPFLRLIEANRRDQRVCRYETWSSLRDYCALSANPVGHLVLAIFDADTPERVARSDSICTALQLVEHCQDVAEDAAVGRIYLPAADLARLGCREEEVRAARASAALRRVLLFEAERATRLLREGEPLVATLSGAPRLAVAAFVAGGDAAVDSLRRVGFDVLAQPPRTRRRDVLRHAGAVLWRQRGRGVRP